MYIIYFRHQQPIELDELDSRSGINNIRELIYLLITLLFIIIREIAFFGKLCNTVMKV